MHTVSESVKSDVRIKIAISFIAAGLMGVRIAWPDVKIDSISIALFFVMLLPWLSSFIDSASLPGGWKISFRKMQDTIEFQEKKIVDQEEEISQQRKMIDDLVIYNMAWFIYDLLKTIYDCKTTGNTFFFNREAHRKNLTFLRDNGYVDIIGIRTLQDGEDITKKIKIAPTGESYIQLRETLLQNQRNNEDAEGLK